MGFVLAGDFVIVSKRASFTPYYSVVGFSPDGGWTALLPDIVGRARAAGVVSANLTISAAQAVDWGIANLLVESDSLADALNDVCVRIMNGCSGTLRASKRLLVPADYRERLEAERRLFVEQAGSAEALAGIRAFVERGNRGGS